MDEERPKEEEKTKEEASRGRISNRLRRNHDWVPYTVATCSAVILYVIILHLDVIGRVFAVIGGFLFPVFLGVVFAYIMNPLVTLVEKRVFFKLKTPRIRYNLSIAVSFLGVAVFIGVLFALLVTQLVESFMSLVTNLDSYLHSLQDLINSLGDSASGLDIDISSFVSSSDNLLSRIEGILPEDPTEILRTSRDIGTSLVNVLLGAVLSLYFLIERDRLLMGIRRLLHSVLSDGAYESSSRFWHKCDAILVRYIVYSILDALIVGIANAVFMLITGMNYVTLISTMVGVTNLAPTFGPIAGAVVGVMILLLVNPLDAFLFLIFTIILQTVDGYVIKPKLFGGTFGISGLWILVGIIVGGRMFGVVGILFAIPAVAIIDYVYQNYLLKKLEERKKARE